MPRITKGNAREHLVDAIKRFQMVTGESIGSVYTWNGTLSVIGNDAFKQHVSETKATVFRALTFEKPILDNSTCVPDKESAMMHLVKQDVNSHNVQTLRKILTWGTQKTTRKPRNFWGKSELQPPFWPKEIPFPKRCKKMCRSTLLSVVQSMQEQFYPELSDGIRDRSPIHSCTSDAIFDDDYLLDSPVHSLTTSVKHSLHSSLNSSPRTYPSSPFDLYDSIPATPVNMSVQQPDQSETPVSHLPLIETSVSIAELSGAIPLAPLDVTLVRVLDTTVREECLRQLSNPDIFLTDVTINAFGVLLKNNYPYIEVVQDTILSKNRQFIKASLNSFQIHHDSGLHWVCSRIDSEGNTFLYDSLFHQDTSEDLDIQLALLYRSETENLRITVQQLQQQRGVSDCGVFAIAVAIALANGLEPNELRWNQNNMRTHLKNMIKSEQLFPLPTLSKTLFSRHKVNKKYEYTIQLWCMCRLPEFASRHMVMCPTCDRWFHKPCIGLKDNSKKIVSFTCRECKANNNKQVK